MKKLAKKATKALGTMKVAIYIRVFTQYQVDRASLPVQPRRAYQLRQICS